MIILKAWWKAKPEDSWQEFYPSRNTSPAFLKACAAAKQAKTPEQPPEPAS